MDILNAAIVGCGGIHNNHARAIAESKVSRLYAVCDIDGAKAEKSANTYGCRFYTDYNEMLGNKEIDVIHICTPHYLHAQMAIDAMRSGKHVLTEKPMAISTADALKMNRVSGETGKTLGVCFQNRYNATSVRIREVLQSEQAGRILGARAFLTWSRTEKYYTESGWRGSLQKEGGGVLINQAIHTLDLLQWLLGEVKGLKAHVDTRLLKNVIEVEDTADVTISFRNGSHCLFYATNNYVANSPVELEIICEKAVLKLADSLDISYSDGTSEHVEETDKATGEKAYWGCSHKYLIRDFYRKLIEGKTFGLSGEQGIRVIRLLEAIYRSSATGEYVKL